MLERTRPQSPFYTAEHEAFRDVMRRFVEKEIEPHASEWDEAGEFPRELYRKASAIGLLQAEPRAIQFSMSYMNQWAMVFAGTVNEEFRAEMKKRNKPI